MGGFSGNPLMRMGAGAVDAYMGVPVASAALSAVGMGTQQTNRRDALQQSYDAQQQMLDRQQQQQLETQQNLLKAQLASQRARMSALGIGGDGGSADALAEGLTRQAATNMANIEQGYGDRVAQLDWKRQSQENQLLQSANDYWGGQLAPVGGSIASSWSGGDDPSAGLSLL